ncbi:unannotated protein [freshwater metagenome]|uniref:Unannotated protein n=1 Tax=freshwater metagenome TaxID=449393 RepID=A0A6J7CW62_9ZZZZ
MFKGLSRHKVLLCLLALFIFGEMIFVASGTYGKTDDYVILGLFSGDRTSMFENFRYISAAEWNAGRWVSNLFLATMFQNGNTVADFTYFRIFAVLALFYGTLKHVRNLVHIEESLVKRLIIASPIVLVPGVHSFITLSVSNPYIIAMVVALLISSHITTIKSWNLKNTILLFTISSLVCAIYQSSVFLITLYPALLVLKKHFDKTSAKCLWQSFSLACGVLFINWFAIKILINSSRSSISLDIYSKVRVFFNVVIDQVISPWLRLAHFDQKLIHLVAITMFLLNFILVAISFSRSKFKESKWNIYQYFAFIFCLTGGLPFTMPWFFLIAENAMDFRRYTFATIIFFSIFLYSILNNSWLNSTKSLQNYTTKVMVVTLLISYTFMSYFDIETRNILAREWSLFSCASNQVQLPEETKIESGRIRQILQGDRTVSEDFSTASISLPNPPTFMLWLSQKQTREDIDFPPWNMNLLQLDSEIAETEEGRRWRYEFIKCSNK